MAASDGFWECTFLSDATNELKKHEQLISKNAKSLYKSYELNYQQLRELLDSEKVERRMGEGLLNARKMKREHDVLETKIAKAEEHTNNALEECKILHSQVIDKKNEVPEFAQQAEHLKEQARTVEEDVKAENKKYGLKNKATLLTKDAFKKNLGLHVRLLKTEEEGPQFVVTFDSTPQPSPDHGSMPFKSVRLSRTPNYGLWKLLETNPPLPKFELLSKSLEDSQDIQGFLAHLQTTFKSIKKISPNLN